MIIDTVQQLRIGGKVAIADVQLSMYVEADQYGVLELRQVNSGDASITKASIGLTDAPLASLLWGVAQAYLDSRAGRMAAQIGRAHV